MIWIFLGIAVLYLLGSKNGTSGGFLATIESGLTGLTSEISSVASSVSGAAVINPANIYTLSAQDIQTIGSQFSDFTNTYEVVDTNATYTLAAAMASAIQNLKIECYIGDGYCVAATGGAQYNYLYPPANPAPANMVPSVAQIASGGVSTAVAITSDISKLATGAVSSVIPFVGTVAQAVLGFIAAKHAAAVTEENKILCSLIPQLNAWYAYIKTNFYAGAWSGADTMTIVQQVQAQAQAAIAQDTSSGALHAIGEEVEAITAAYQYIIEKSNLG